MSWDLSSILSSSRTQKLGDSSAVQKFRAHHELGTMRPQLCCMVSGELIFQGKPRPMLAPLLKSGYGGYGKSLKSEEKSKERHPTPSQSHQCRSDGIKPRQLSSFPNLSFWMLHLPTSKGHTKPTTARPGPGPNFSKMAAGRTWSGARHCPCQPAR